MNEETKTVVETTTDNQPEVDVAALQAELEQLKADNAKLKKANNDVSSDAAEWKRKYRDNLSEQARKEEEAAEAAKAVQAELNGLRKEKVVSNYTSKYLALGYDEENAVKAAQALAENDTATLFEIQKTQQQTSATALKKELLNQTPHLTPGAPIKGEDIENKFLAAFRKSAGLNTN